MKKILMMNRLLLFLLFGAGVSAQAQEPVSISPDCDQATPLFLTRDNVWFRSITAPQGFGTMQEMNARLGDSLWIAAEHHSAWFVWESPFTGYLGLDLTPESPADDYDFLLFRDTMGLGCQAIRSKTLLPERSLISRNDPSIQSRTGLNGDRRASHVAAGIGPSYGQAVQVKRGERWLLLIDNVYDGGEGFDLTFHYFYAPGLRGVLRDKTSDEPLQASLQLLEAGTDSVIETIETDPEGRFQTDRLLEIGRQYRLTATAPGHLQGVLQLNYPKLRANRGRPLEFELISDQPGTVIDLPDVHFQAATAEFMPSALAALEELFDLLTENPEVRVRVEGHVNGVGTEDCENDPFQQSLSRQRAKAVFDYLTERGIRGSRMHIAGFGCTRMIYPEAKNEAEMAANRRVEVVVE